LSNPRPLTLEDPLDIDEARRAARALARQRRDAEEFHTNLVEEAAEAEREYRKAYAVAFVKAGGTVTAREALAKADTADLAYKRDLKAGMVKVAAERLRGLEGERSMLRALLDWSMRLDPLGERQPEQYESAIGGKR
jgi:hypothetical protein